MDRYLAIHAPEPGMEEAEFRAALARMAEAGNALGLRIPETIYNLAAGRVFSLVEADNPIQVRDAASQAGLHLVEVVPADVVYTELLSEPRRG